MELEARARGAPLFLRPASVALFRIFFLLLLSSPTFPYLCLCQSNHSEAAEPTSRVSSYPANALQEKFRREPRARDTVPDEGEGVSRPSKATERQVSQSVGSRAPHDPSVEVEPTVSAHGRKRRPISDAEASERTRPAAPRRRGRLSKKQRSEARDGPRKEALKPKARPGRQKRRRKHSVDEEEDLKPVPGEEEEPDEETELADLRPADTRGRGEPRRNKKRQEGGQLTDKKEGKKDKKEKGGLAPPPRRRPRLKKRAKGDREVPLFRRGRMASGEEDEIDTEEDEEEGGVPGESLEAPVSLSQETDRDVHAAPQREERERARLLPPLPLAREEFFPGAARPPFLTSRRKRLRTFDARRREEASRGGGDGGGGFYRGGVSQRRRPFITKTKRT